MSTVEYIERKRLLIRFTFFYAISLGLAALIITSLYSWQTKTPGIGVGAEEQAVTLEQERILGQSARLEVSLKLLQGYDEQYQNLLSSSSNRSELSELVEKINLTENVLSKRIIELRNEKSGYRTPGNAILAEKIIGFNLLALKSRTNLAIFRSSLARAGDKATPDRDLYLKWSSMLTGKDQKIIQLEKELEENKSTAGVNYGLDESMSMQNESLRLSVTESVKKLQSVTEISQSLKKENARLTERLAEFQKAATLSRNTNAERSNAESLNAELTFAHVDCNLVRADAKQIISNARQRRELLNEALRILNILAKSDNIEIKEKVNERISALNYISKNIRE